jgi:glycine cleavage system H protein
MEPTTGLTEVAGFPVDLARAYHPDTHLWVLGVEGGRVRVGLDALGVETSGGIAALAFVESGSDLLPGEPFGSLEAAKFVGPFLSPVAGRLAAVNEAVLADPSLVDRDPYGAGWLIEFEAEPGTPPLAAGADLVSGADDVSAWFATAVEDYRLKGVLAE